MNRDELVDRPAGRPPMQHAARRGRMLVTVDGLAGGAWIAVHDDGLMACILNRTVTGDLQPAGSRTSRGVIVMEAVQAGSAIAVPDQLRSLALEKFQPFTVLAADVHDTVILSWNGHRLSAEPTGAIRCSSGLGDGLVTDARHTAWNALTRDGITSDAQDQWHCSRSGADSAAWVLMTRPGARTVSRSHVDISPAGVRLTDSLLSPQGTEISRLHLDLPR